MCDGVCRECCNAGQCPAMANRTASCTNNACQYKDNCTANQPCGTDTECVSYKTACVNGVQQCNPTNKSASTVCGSGASAGTCASGRCKSACEGVNCGAHGSCVQGGTCQCRDGYTSPSNQCSTPPCTPNEVCGTDTECQTFRSSCANGVRQCNPTNRPSSTRCGSGASSGTCSNGRCKSDCENVNCGAHGACIAGGTCQCKDGYTTADASSPCSTPPCKSEKCTPSDPCKVGKTQCPGGACVATGDLCDLNTQVCSSGVCSTKCVGGGVCNTNQNHDNCRNGVYACASETGPKNCIDDSPKTSGTCAGGSKVCDGNANCIEPCGGEGQKCCNNDACTGGLQCDLDSVVTGARACKHCGRTNEWCCRSGSKCVDGDACSSGASGTFCSPCGGLGQPCCTTPQPCRQGMCLSGAFGLTCK